MSDDNSTTFDDEFDNDRAAVAVEVTGHAAPPETDDDRPHINDQLAEQVADSLYLARDILGLDSTDDIQVVTGVNATANQAVNAGAVEVGNFDDLSAAREDSVLYEIEPEKIRQNQDDNEVLDDITDENGNDMTVAQVEAENPGLLRSHNKRVAAEYRAGHLADLGVELVIVIDSNSDEAEYVIENFKEEGLDVFVKNVKSEVDWSTYYDYLNGEGEFADDEADEADAESVEADGEAEAEAEA